MGRRGRGSSLNFVFALFCDAGCGLSNDNEAFLPHNRGTDIMLDFISRDFVYYRTYGFVVYFNCRRLRFYLSFCPAPR